jgi:hypothetical protein
LPCARLTEAEIEEARRRSREVRETPMVIVHGKDLPYVAREAFMGWLDELAVAHDLPAPGKLPDGSINHYGMAPDGEFTRWVDDGVEHAQYP